MQTNIAKMTALCSEIRAFVRPDAWEDDAWLAWQANVVDYSKDAWSVPTKPPKVKTAFFGELSNVMPEVGKKMTQFAAAWVIYSDACKRCGNTTATNQIVTSLLSNVSESQVGKEFHVAQHNMPATCSSRLTMVWWTSRAGMRITSCNLRQLTCGF